MFVFDGHAHGEEASCRPRRMYTQHQQHRQEQQSISISHTETNNGSKHRDTEGFLLPIVRDVDAAGSLLHPSQVALKTIPATVFKGNKRAQEAIRSEVEAMRVRGRALSRQINRIGAKVLWHAFRRWLQCMYETKTPLLVNGDRSMCCVRTPLA